MLLTNKTCKDFVSELASKSPVPGGGSAAAMVGAIGLALSNMVGNLTVGKKKYLEYEPEIKQLIAEGEKLLSDLQALVDKDAETFEPLAKAYGLPRSSPEQIEARETIIEMYSKKACLVPLEIMNKAYQGIKIHERMAQIGTTVAISDIGCGVTFLKAALIAGSLNILINLKKVTDHSFVKDTKDKMNTWLINGSSIADKIMNQVAAQLN